MRNDKHQNKVAQVRQNLKRLCQEKNFELIYHKNTITVRHLNGSKLPLDKRVTTNTIQIFYRSNLKLYPVTI